MWLSNSIGSSPLQGGADGRKTGWVDFVSVISLPACLPTSALTGVNLAESADQLGKMVEHPNKGQPNPFFRPPALPCMENIAYKLGELRGRRG